MKSVSRLNWSETRVGGGGSRIGEFLTPTQSLEPQRLVPQKPSRPFDPARLDVAAFLTARRLATPRPLEPPLIRIKPQPHRRLLPSSANIQRHKPPPSLPPFPIHRTRRREQQGGGGGVRASPCLASFKRSPISWRRRSWGGDSAMATKNHRAAAPQPANRGERSKD